MRVCYIATTVHLSQALGEGVGSTTHTYNLAAELARLGDSVVVVTERWEGDKAVEDICGLKVYRLFRGWVVSAKKIRKSPFGFLAAFLKPVSNLSLALQVADLARREQCGVLFERAQSMIGGLVSVLCDKPLAVEVIDNLFSKFSLERATRVFAYTDKFFEPHLAEKIELVSAGADLRLFKPLKTRPRYDACYVGSFKEWDGLEDLVEALAFAAKERPGLRVALVGQGPRLETVKALAAARGLEENLLFLGAKGMQETAEIINASEIGLAPYNVSRSRKGEFKKYGYYFSPLKVIEYMACGKAVVATDYELVRRLLPPGNALVKEGDAKGLARALLELLADDNRYAVERNNLLQAKEFSWARLAHRVHEALEEATG